MGIDTITRSLQVQQLNQDIIAENLANAGSSVDANGYLVHSLQEFNTASGSPIIINNGVQNFAIGTGPQVSQITRYRSLYLDGQIQQQSSVVGNDEILNSVLNQVNSIINSSATSTLSSALNNFAAAWQALGAAPVAPATDATNRQAVVAAGTAFADMARSQYSQLQTLEVNMDGQVTQTIGNINQLLQQLASINYQLNNSQGSNPNDLLDARDYALDQLSRLINIQTTFGNNGTANVFLGGLDLVNSYGAGSLTTNANNSHNPNLVSVSYQGPANPNSLMYYTPSTGPGVSAVTQVVDVTNMITGGNLAGELTARDVVLESYKDQVDQIATSVMNLTNTIHVSGFAADGTTSGLFFFVGTGGEDISVNAALINNTNLLAQSSTGTVNGVASPLPANKQIAQFLGNLPALLANNFAGSPSTVWSGVGALVNPNNPMATENFANTPAGAGSVTIDGVVINYNANTDSIAQLLQNINNNVPNVDAVFDYTNQQFFIFSNDPVQIQNGAGLPSFTGFTNIQNILVSSLKLNNSFAYTNPQINQNQALNSYNNTTAFRITPSTSGSFTINGTVVYSPVYVSAAIQPWTSKTTINAMSNQIFNAVPAVTAELWTDVSQTLPTFFGGNTNINAFTMTSSSPMEVVDTTGNFSVFTGLNANMPVNDLANSILANITNDVSNQQSVTTTAEDSLTQLNNAQDSLAGVATTSSGAGSVGVPLATIQEQAMQSLNVYNASLQVLNIMNEMLSDLIDIVGGSSSSTTFQTSQSSTS